MKIWRLGSQWFQCVFAKLASPAFRRVGWGLCFFLVTVFIISSGYYSKGYTLKMGEISSSDIRAPRNISYVDEIETAKLRQDAANRVEKIYREDTQAAVLADENIQSIYAKVAELKGMKITQEDQVNRLLLYLSQVTGTIGVDRNQALPDGALATLLQLSSANLKDCRELSQRLLQEELRYGLKTEALSSARNSITEKIGWSGIPKSWQPAVKLILTRTIRPTLVFDEESYTRQVASVQAAVPLVQRLIQAGQIIVREGNPIDAQDLVMLKQIGLLKGRQFWPSLLGACSFVILLGGLTFFYLRKFKCRLLENDQFIFLYGLLFMLTLFFAKCMTFIRISPQPEIANLVGYLSPLALGAMLITVLLDSGLAVYTAFVLSILLGIMMDGQLSFVIVGLVGSLAGIYSISGMNDRAGLIRGGIFVSLANALAIMTLGLLNETSARLVFSGMGMGLFNGLFSSVLALGCLPYLETAFGITSSVRLLELSNPNQVLLKRLLMEAPGTYHHSILVGNLAESAAEAVQADPLLVRVGSYYHDIGKLKRPYFFIENQVTRDNPHDKIAPSLSTLIITSHVKDGLELAREHKIPRSVEAIIEQHHGTGVVAYFYQRALDSDRPELVAESDFRYDSVKPQSKEAALVMLADCVEAAVRSLQKPTPGRLEGLTRKIIKEKLHDGQLDECDLTFKDLNRIATAFVRVLGGIFHSRIEYPETMITEIEKRRSRGAVVNQ